MVPAGCYSRRERVAGGRHPREDAAMTTPSNAPVACDQQHASVFVSDLNAAIEFYTKTLGFTVAFTWGDPPAFAGVNLDKTQIFLDAAYPPNPSGCCLFFNVDDVDALYEFHRERGADVAQP